MSTRTSRRWVHGRPWVGVLALLLPAFCLLPAAPAAADSADPGATPPRLLLDGDILHLTHLPPVLEDEEVRRHLATGLTTTFVFRLNGRDGSGRKFEGAARVEIRYEPWDEVYFLEALGVDGAAQRESSGSAKGLAVVWHDLRLPVLRPRGSAALIGRWRVELDVIPFSRGEQRDTQRWFSESMERDGNAEETARSSDDRSETLGEVFNLLLATSIQRRAMSSYSWQVEVARGLPR